MKLFAVALMGAFALSAQAQPAPTPRPATHGMLVFGEESVFFSHLPMFHEPHRFQVLLEAELPPTTLAAYRNFLRTTARNPELVTFVPKPFSLSTKESIPNPLIGDLIGGHFERPGNRPIQRLVQAKIKKIWVFEKFTNDRHDARKLYPVYLLGTPNDAYLVHKIFGKPNFDQVFKLVEGPETRRLPATAFGQVFELSTLPSPRKESILDTPVEKDLGKIILEPQTSTPGRASPAVTVERSLYLEKGELDWPSP